MGMYTELCIAVEFKKGTPSEVIDAVDAMTREETNHPGLDHALFRTERWRWMLRSGGSYYFDAKPCLKWEYDEISKSWFLTVWTNIKNYSREWETFLEFIAPHIEGSRFEPDPQYIGHMRYEEDQRPTLLWANGQTITYER